MEHIVLTQSTNRGLRHLHLCCIIYEPPLNPDLVLKAGETSVQECVEKVVNLLAGKACT